MTKVAGILFLFVRTLDFKGFPDLEGHEDEVDISATGNRATAQVLGATGTPEKQAPGAED